MGGSAAGNQTRVEVVQVVATLCAHRSDCGLFPNKPPLRNGLAVSAEVPPLGRRRRMVRANPARPRGRHSPSPHRRPFTLIQVLVLVIGDLHIPHRTADIPKKFKALLVPGKIQAATSFDPDPVTAGARSGCGRGGARLAFLAHAPRPPAQHLICTGNICDKPTLDYFKSLCSDVHVVRLPATPTDGAQRAYTRKAGPG